MAFGVYETIVSGLFGSHVTRAMGSKVSCGIANIFFVVDRSVPASVDSMPPDGA